jgi:hypothetical protein
MKCPNTLLATAAAVVVCAAAQAAPDAAHLFGDMFFNRSPPERISPSTFGSFALADPGLGTLSILAAGTPFPLLVADAEIGPDPLPLIFGRASMSLFYGIEIVGAPGVVPVLIDATGEANGTASAGASFALQALWRLEDNNGTVLAGDQIDSGESTGNFGQAFSHRVGVSLLTNHVYQVVMLTDASAAAGANGSFARGHAAVDPIFSFGAGVDPRLYAFEFSAGIGNGPAASVPEPAGLTLCGLGLVVLCLESALRTTRRRPALCPAPAGGMVVR